MNDLTVGKPLKVILTFSVPILIGNIFNMAYSLADTRIIGHYLGNAALGAVGSVSTLMDLLVLFFLGLANGFGVITAREYGRKDEEAVRRSFSHALLIGSGLTLAAEILCLILLRPILSIMNVASEHIEAGSAYIVVILIGLVFSYLYNLLAAELRAIGDAITPLAFLIVSIVLNVALDILFVGPFQKGVGGAALATVISQLCAACFCFLYLWKKHQILRLTKESWKMSGSVAKQLLSAGLSMGFMSSLVQFGTVSLQSAINTFGTNIIVAHAATRKLFMLLTIPFATVSTIMATYTGQNYGAGKMDRIKEGMKWCLTITYVWSLIIILIAYTISPFLIQAITGTSEPEILYWGSMYQKMNSLLIALVPTICVIRNMLQGMGDYVTPLVSSGIELAGKVVFAFLLAPFWEYWAIIWSEPVVWALMVIPLIISAVRRLKK